MVTSWQPAPSERFSISYGYGVLRPVAALKAVTSNMSIETEEMSLTTIDGNGQVLLNIKELDLNQCLYYYDAGVYSQD